MLEKNYVIELKKCLSYNEIWKLMEGREYKKLHGTKFEDEILKVSTKTMSYYNKRININSRYFELAFRTLLFLKFDGELNSIPQLSGKQNYFNNLQYILNDILQQDDKIENFYDIDVNIIDMIIEKYRNDDNNQFLRPLIYRLNILKEWIMYANEKLPFFFQLDDSILDASRSYKKLLIDYAAERKIESTRFASPKFPYPLGNLKKLFADAMIYLENYTDDCLSIATVYMKTTQMKHMARYSYIFDHLKYSKHQYVEPELAQLQNSCRLARTKYISSAEEGTYNSTRVSSIASNCEYAIKRLEAACVIIIIFMTGMRSQELYLLNRYPEITQGEHYQLKRLVYKTAATESGDILKIPIPPIAKIALETLSRISEIKDDQNNGKIFTSDIKYPDAQNFHSRIGNIIDFFATYIGLDLAPTPHQLRHAMAFLIVHINEKDGLELGKMFLHHDSIIMTLEYMAHYNLLFKEAIKNLHKNESGQLIDHIVEEVKDGKNLYGSRGEGLLSTFVGSCVEGIGDLIDISLRGLIEKGQFAIIQTPVCFCVHDLTKQKEMACQRGFSMTDFVGHMPKASRCEGGNCENAILTEENVEELIVDYSDVSIELQDRLMQNTYFADIGGFESIDNSNKKILEKYKKDKEKSDGTVIRRAI